MCQEENMQSAETNICNIFEGENKSTNRSWRTMSRFGSGSAAVSGHLPQTTDNVCRRIEEWMPDCRTMFR